MSPSQGFSGHTSALNTDLLQGLKRVMNCKELEDRLPAIKNAILTIQVI